MKEKQDSYEKRLSEYWWFQWELIRRHQDYKRFCDTHPFKNKKLIDEADSSKKAMEIKKRFSLRTIYHYSFDISGPECFENFNIFDNRLAVVRIWPEFTPKKNGPQSFIPPELPTYGDFIYVGINIAEEVKWQDIEAQVWRYVLHARAVRDIKSKEKRFHFTRDSLEIWDLYEKGKSPTEIIKTLWPEEYEKGVQDSEDALERKYTELFEKYKSEDVKDDNAKAYEETYGKAGTGNTKLYKRVQYNIDKMKEMLQSF